MISNPAVLPSGTNLHWPLLSFEENQNWLKGKIEIDTERVGWGEYIWKVVQVIYMFSEKFMKDFFGYKRNGNVEYVNNCTTREPPHALVRTASLLLFDLGKGSLKVVCGDLSQVECFVSNLGKCLS